VSRIVLWPSVSCTVFNGTPSESIRDATSSCRDGAPARVTAAISTIGRAAHRPHRRIGHAGNVPVGCVPRDRPTGGGIGRRGGPNLFGNLSASNAEHLGQITGRLVILPKDRRLTDLPDFAHLKGKPLTFDSTPDHPRTCDEFPWPRRGRA
jgi:hypothetical protein